MLRQSWDGVSMLTFFELAHILDATLLCFSCVHKHVDVTHLMHINMPRSFLSNILDATPVMGWGETQQSKIRGDKIRGDKML